ncbi:MAG TPA: glutamine amidotransferase [Mycobacteriales bacterium]|nr:glutamine amidotransferase [Mycobacteriales bacterium]
MADPVRIGLLYPSLLGTYGDGGNALVLERRLRWRGIDAETVRVEIDDHVPEELDLYVLGGGEDSAQTLAVSRLGNGVLSRAVAAAKPVFAVCAGFQILGETFLDGTGEVYAGLGLIDCRTDRLPGARAVGELLGQAGDDGIGTVTGYENHGGRTVLGAAARPFAAVRSGVGNGDGDIDGAIQGSVVATYLHGPALARNPALADHLLMAVCGPLPALDDVEEHELRRERLAALRRAKLARWRRQWRPAARSR